MTPRTLLCILLLGAAAISFAQLPDERRPRDPDQPIRLPNGKLQSEEILKADFKKSMDDADELIKLSQDVKADLEKNTAHVLALSTLRKLDEIEKVTRRMRNRMKR